MNFSSKWVAFLARRRVLVVTLYALALAPSVWLASKMPLDLDLLNLLPEDIAAIKTVRKMESWSGKIGYLYIGLERTGEGATVDTMKDYADRVANDLAKSPLVKRANAAMDLSALVQAAPLFLEPDDMAEAGARMKELVKTQIKKQSGLYVDLEDDEENAENAVTFDDLIEKYRKRFQADAAPKKDGQDAGTAALAKLQAKFSADGKRFFYMSPDELMLTFLVEPSFPVTDLRQFPELTEQLTKAFADAKAAIPGAAGLEVFVGGAYALQWDTRDATLADFQQSSLISLVLIFFITWFTVRRLRSVFMVFGSLLVALAISAGAAWVVVGRVNVITVFRLAVLGDLCVDFGMYFATRAQSLLDTGLKRANAIPEAWRQTAVPAAMGALTMMCVFVLLSFGQFRGFAEMGRISAMGVAIAWLVMYSLLPVLFLFFGQEKAGAEPTLEEARRLVSEEEGAVEQKSVSRFFPAGKMAPVYLGIALFLTVAAVLSATRVRFAITGKEFTVEGQKSLAIDERIQEHYGEAIDYTVVLAEDEAQARRIQKHFEENFGKYGQIARYESAFTYVPPADQQQKSLEKMGDLRWAIERLPKNSDDPAIRFAMDRARDMKDPTPVALSNLPDELQMRFVGRDEKGAVRGYLGYIVPKEWLWDMRVLRGFVEELQTIKVDGKPIEMTGRAQIFQAVIDIVQREALMFSLIGLALIFLVLWAQARSAKFVALAMLPLFIGTVWMLGTLPFIGKEGLNLSFMNLVVFPILVGLGVSYGVQITYNFRIYGSAEKALRVLILPILGSSTTTLAGWTTLVPASMIGLQGIGWLATLGMVFITLFSLAGLPALLAVLQKRGLLVADKQMEGGEGATGEDSAKAA